MMRTKAGLVPSYTVGSHELGSYVYDFFYINRFGIFLRALFTLSFLRAKPKEEPEEIEGGWLKIQHGPSLVQKAEYSDLLDSLFEYSYESDWLAFGIRSQVLNKFAEFVQLLPAAAYYHHPEKGGLLRHSMECASQILFWTRTAVHALAPDHWISDRTFEKHRDAIEFVTWLLALTHDIGKVLSMFSIELRCEKSDGMVDVKMYDARDGGFGVYSLYETRLRLERSSDYKSVRYRFTFRHGQDRHNHERYWLAGAQQLIRALYRPLDNKYDPGTPLSGTIVKEYLQEEADGFKLVEPIVHEIDQRSVVEWHNSVSEHQFQNGRLYGRALSELSSLPQFQSCSVYEVFGNHAFVFLPVDVLDRLLQSLPSTYDFQGVSGHPTTFIKHLKAEGLTAWVDQVDSTGEFLQVLNGKTGVFLNWWYSRQLAGGNLFSTANIGEGKCTLGQLMNRTLTSGIADKSDLPSKIANAGSPEKAGSQAYSARTGTELSLPNATGAQDSANPLIMLFAGEFAQLSIRELHDDEHVETAEHQFVFLPGFTRPRMRDWLAAGTITKADVASFSDDVKKVLGGKWRFERGTLTCSKSWVARPQDQSVKG